MTLLTNQNCNGFKVHRTQHDGLEEEEEDCARNGERGECKEGDKRAHNKH